jgi:hypothetical protein
MSQIARERMEAMTTKSTCAGETCPNVTDSTERRTDAIAPSARRVIQIGITGVVVVETAVKRTLDATAEGTVVVDETVTASRTLIAGVNGMAIVLMIVTVNETAKEVEKVGTRGAENGVASRSNMATTETTGGPATGTGIAIGIGSTAATEAVIVIVIVTSTSEATMVIGGSIGTRSAARLRHLRVPP